MTRHQKHMALARAVAKIFSKDPTTGVGAVVIGRQPNHLAIGYNGLPPGLRDDERLHDRQWKNDHTRHAEANALSNVYGFEPVEIYATHFPCERCALDILAARTVKRVITCTPTGEFAERWAARAAAARAIFDEAGIEVLEIEP